MRLENLVSHKIYSTHYHVHRLPVLLLVVYRKLYCVLTCTTFYLCQTILHVTIPLHHTTARNCTIASHYYTLPYIAFALHNTTVLNVLYETVALRDFTIPLQYRTLLNITICKTKPYITIAENYDTELHHCVAAPDRTEPCHCCTKPYFTIA